MATDLAAFDNYFQTQLEAEPQTAYMGIVGQRFGDGGKGFMAGAQNYFQDNFSNMYNKHLGQKGQELMTRSKALSTGQDMSKQPPLTSFMDYLQRDVANPFTERYASMTPRQRGTSTSKFAPSTRYILY